MLILIALAGGVVVGYFGGVYRHKIINLKNKVEVAVKEEFKQ